MATKDLLTIDRLVARPQLDAQSGLKITSYIAVYRFYDLGEFKKANRIVDVCPILVNETGLGNK